MSWNKWFYKYDPLCVCVCTRYQHQHRIKQVKRPKFPKLNSISVGILATRLRVITMHWLRATAVMWRTQEIRAEAAVLTKNHYRTAQLYVSWYKPWIMNFLFVQHQWCHWHYLLNCSKHDSRRNTMRDVTLCFGCLKWISILFALQKWIKTSFCFHYEEMIFSKQSGPWYMCVYVFY